MVTDEMMKRAIEAYAKDTGAEGFQLEGWIEPAIRAALEAALSAAEPYGWLVKTKGSPWKGTFYSSEPLFGQGVWDREDYEITPVYDRPQQPSPSVAVKAEKTKCKNCRGDLNSWFPSNRVNSLAVDGRLKSNEISCDFVLGCDECSETLRVVPADEIARQMNSALSAQVQDVAGTEAIAALKEAEPYVEICHSLMTQKETRANVWRVLKQVRAAIAAAPAKQEG